MKKAPPRLVILQDTSDVTLQPQLQTQLQPMQQLQPQLQPMQPKTVFTLQGMQIIQTTPAAASLGAIAPSTPFATAASITTRTGPVSISVRPMAAQLPNQVIPQPAALPTMSTQTPNKYELTWQQYSEKSVVVRAPANTPHHAEISADMARLSGKYNERLKGGPGWIFPLVQLDRIKNYLTTGSYYMPRNKGSTEFAGVSAATLTGPVAPIPATSMVQKAGSQRIATGSTLIRTVQLPTVSEVSAFFTQPRNQLYPGMFVQQMVVNCRNPNISSLVNIFNTNRSYYGIEVIAALNLGSVPSRTEIFKWDCSSDGKLLFALFGPRDKIITELNKIGLTGPGIDTIADGEIAIVSGYHQDIQPDIQQEEEDNFDYEPND